MTCGRSPENARGEGFATSGVMVIKLPGLGRIKEYKCMVILRAFPYNNALFGLVKKMTPVHKILHFYSSFFRWFRAIQRIPLISSAFF